MTRLTRSVSEGPLQRGVERWVGEHDDVALVHVMPVEEGLLREDPVTAVSRVAFPRSPPRSAALAMPARGIVARGLLHRDAD